MMVETFLDDIGIMSGMNLLVHSSFSKIRAAFGDITPYELITPLMKRLTGRGSLIMPAFTYCFKKSEGKYEIFDPDLSPALTGAVTEFFRHMPGVIRTASPTHSFSIWGRVQQDISCDNAPSSALGSGSVMDWLTNQSNSYILMLGVDFTSLSYGHYLEVKAPVPWLDFSPWDYMHILKIGSSIYREHELTEIPGCSKGFKAFENYLYENGKIETITIHGLNAILLNVEKLFHDGLSFYRRFPDRLLCPAGECQACDARWEYYLNKLKNAEN